MKKRQCLKNGVPILLSCAGAAGVVATAVFAVKATPKAEQLIKQAEYAKEEKLSKAEVAKTVWKLYIPSVAFGATTILCIIGSCVLNRKQQAALIGAYAMLDSSYQNYKNKVKELYGEDAHRDIVKSMVVEKSKDTHVTAITNWSEASLDFENDDEPTRLFYDCISKRYFETTVTKVLEAEYHLNRNFVIGGYVTLNEFYEFLGLKKTNYGDNMGWEIYDDMFWIDFDHSKVVHDDGLECYIIDAVVRPQIF